MSSDGESRGYSSLSLGHLINPKLQLLCGDTSGFPSRWDSYCILAGHAAQKCSVLLTFNMKAPKMYKINQTSLITSSWIVSGDKLLPHSPHISSKPTEEPESMAQVSCRGKHRKRIAFAFLNWKVAMFSQSLPPNGDDLKPLGSMH